eukprot:2378278-Prymnesium_polylepis.1
MSTIFLGIDHFRAKKQRTKARRANAIRDRRRMRHRLLSSAAVRLCASSWNGTWHLSRRVGYDAVLRFNGVPEERIQEASRATDVQRWQTRTHAATDSNSRCHRVMQLEKPSVTFPVAAADLAVPLCGRRLSLPHGPSHTRHRLPPELCGGHRRRLHRRVPLSADRDHGEPVQGWRHRGRRAAGVAA